MCTELPALTACRLANPPCPIGTWAVSPAITRMSAGATLNWSAAIWASMVAVPCPIAAAPVDTVIRPDRPMRTMPVSNGPRPVPLVPLAMPMPMWRPSASAATLRAAKPS